MEENDGALYVIKSGVPGFSSSSTDICLFVIASPTFPSLPLLFPATRFWCFRLMDTHVALSSVNLVCFDLTSSWSVCRPTRSQKSVLPWLGYIDVSGPVPKRFKLCSKGMPNRRILHKVRDSPQHKGFNCVLPAATSISKSFVTRSLVGFIVRRRV
jgi:hypothetical protein